METQGPEILHEEVSLFKELRSATQNYYQSRDERRRAELQDIYDKWGVEAKKLAQAGNSEFAFCELKDGEFIYENGNIYGVPLEFVKRFQKMGFTCRISKIGYRHFLVIGWT